MEHECGVYGGIDHGAGVGTEIGLYWDGVLGIFDAFWDGWEDDVGEDYGVGWVVEEDFCEKLADESCSAGDEDFHFDFRC